VNKDITVVIATLGGGSLLKTLRLINKSTILPKEILVCSPNLIAKQKIPIENSLNIKFLHTKKIGQVAQRAEGLLSAVSPVVLQMDDDIYIQPQTIEQLLKILSSYGSKYAISPIYCDDLTKKPLIEYRGGLKGFSRNLLDFIFFGSKWGVAKMGSISASGVPFYYDLSFINSNSELSDWIPGGMVMCYRENLIFEDYYPFQGKAYFEDVIHSILWKKKGINLIAAKIFVSTPIDDQSFAIKKIFLEHQRKIYVTKLLKRNIFYCYSSTFYSLIIFILKQVLLKKYKCLK
jgi:glycosyltransferase involved in cell wall biosynthesis